MKLHIDCKCGCDVLVVEKIVGGDEHGPAIYYLNMYRSSDKSGFWRRLRQAWEYFRSGEFAYADMAVETKDLNRMIEFLASARDSEELGFEKEGTQVLNQD